MSVEWLNGIGLTLNIAGVVLIFRFGVPYYRSGADAGNSYLLLEADDPEAAVSARRASWLSYDGLALLGFGFVLQLIADLGS